MNNFNILKNSKNILRTGICCLGLTFGVQTAVLANNPGSGQKAKEITIDIGGDVTLTQDIKSSNRFYDYLKNISKNTKIDLEQIMSYPFSGLKETFQNSYTIVNFESSALEENIDKKLYKSDKKGDRVFHFAVSEKIMDVISKNNSSIEAVSIANNHSYDFGKKGFDTLKKFLEKQEITNFGNNTCKNLEVKYDEYNGVKIALIGGKIFNKWQLENEKKLLEKALKEAKINESDIIVVYYHWGKELSQTPENYQISLAEFACENGASLVAGSHQHILSGVQIYETKTKKQVPIAYGLGNLLFGGNINQKEKDTFIFRNTFEYNESTKEYEFVLNKNIPIDVGNVYNPKVAKGQNKDKIEQKIVKRSQLFEKYD